MPYHIEKSAKPRGWFVVDDKGRQYSKKPHKTKAKATAQLRALYIHTNPQSEEGAGIFDKAKDIYENVKGRFSGVRNDYSPSIRSLLKKIGNQQIIGIQILRKPVNSYLKTALNIISLGQFQQELNKKGFDKIFHLFMKVSYNGGAVILEKNEIINIKPWNDSMASGAEIIDVPLLGKSLTINEFLDNGKKQMGSNFFPYSAFSNNCQVFLKGLLEGSGLYNQAINSFVYQDLQHLENQLKSTSKIADFITSSAAKLNTLIYGRGFELGF